MAIDESITDLWIGAAAADFGIEWRRSDCGGDGGGSDAERRKERRRSRIRSGPLRRSGDGVGVVVVGLSFIPTCPFLGGGGPHPIERENAKEKGTGVSAGWWGGGDHVTNPQDKSRNEMETNDFDHIRWLCTLPCSGCWKGKSSEKQKRKRRVTAGAGWCALTGVVEDINGG